MRCDPVLSTTGTRVLPHALQQQRVADAQKVSVLVAAAGVDDVPQLMHDEAAAIGKDKFGVRIVVELRWVSRDAAQNMGHLPCRDQICLFASHEDLTFKESKVTVHTVLVWLRQLKTAAPRMG